MRGSSYPWRSHRDAVSPSQHRPGSTATRLTATHLLLVGGAYHRESLIRSSSFPPAPSCVCVVKARRPPPPRLAGLSEASAPPRPHAPKPRRRCTPDRRVLASRGWRLEAFRIVACPGTRQVHPGKRLDQDGEQSAGLQAITRCETTLLLPGREPTRVRKDISPRTTSKYTQSSQSSHEYSLAQPGHVADQPRLGLPMRSGGKGCVGSP